MDTEIINLIKLNLLKDIQIDLLSLEVIKGEDVKFSDIWDIIKKFEEELK